MNRILTAIKLDFYTAKGNLYLSGLTFVIAVAVGTFSEYPVMTLMLTMLFATFLGTQLFSIYEKNNLNKLYGVLPLRKGEMVAGRYLYALIVGLCNIAVASLTFIIISKIDDVPVETEMFFLYIALAFVYYCFALSVNFPMYIRFSFSKAYIFTILPMAILAVGVVVFARKADRIGMLNDFLQFFSKRQSLLLLLGFSIGGVLLTVSAFTANAIYKGREL